MSIAKDIKKCVEVISSCNTIDHKQSALKMVDNLSRKHNCDLRIINDLKELIFGKEIKY